MSLKILQEISSLVTDFTKNNRFVELKSGEEGDAKYLQLIKGLSEKAWTNESDASRDIYGNKLGDKTFGMLKTRAKERLLNMIFQLDTEKRFKSSYDKSYFLTCKNLLAGTILLNQNRSNAGNEHLKIALKNALHYQFTDLSIIAFRLLRYASSFSGSRKNYNFYNDGLKNAIEKLDSEMMAEELDQEIILNIRAVASEEVITNMSKLAYLKLKNTLRKHDSYTIRLSMCRVGLRFYEGKGDYANAIKLATECEEYLLANPHLIQRVRLGEMNLHKLLGSLHMRDYENGSIYAETCKTLFNPGTLNWLIFLEYYFLLCLHTGNSEKAMEVYNQVITHPTFNTYTPQSKEKWKIFESFLMYELASEGRSTKKFNFNRFINEVPIFSKDKAGYNLSIIISQILWLVNLGEYSRILDKAEPLRQYASRYIKREKNPRSFYFIKMLLTMVKYDFDAKKTEQISAKFFEKLKAAGLGEQSDLESLEVIPYDLLWPEILKKLDENKKNQQQN